MIMRRSPGTPFGIVLPGNPSWLLKSDPDNLTKIAECLPFSSLSTAIASSFNGTPIVERK
jgi:hypothetical protein